MRTVLVILLILGGIGGYAYWQQHEKDQKRAAAAAGSGDAPAVFSRLSYADARGEAASAGKFFLVKATADWCPPCKEMNRTTWLDRGVTTWVDSHAVAAQLDIDAEKATADQFRISAIPTMILFRGDKEVARVVGYQSADQLLAWLKAHESSKGG